MLTNELLRYDVGELTVKPRYLTRKHAERYLAIARGLIHLFRAHVGKTRGELQRALERYEQDRVNFKIVRGLVKILEGLAEFAPDQGVDYAALRAELFEWVEPFRPVVRQVDLLHEHQRDRLLRRFSQERGDLPQHLYGDLPEYHRLVSVGEITPTELLRRYNLALAQGLLYRCFRMQVWVGDHYKTVFHYLKLAQLMHRIRKTRDGYHIVVDGPFSMFRRTQKYGVNLARFLPGLLLAERWRMSAEIRTEQGVRHFNLDQNCGLHSHYRKEHPFDSSVEEAFYNVFRRRKTEWEIERESEIVDLGDTVLIPDFRLRHPDGRSFLLEIVGFWTPEYLEKKLDKLRRAGRKDLIVAVNETLNCSKEDFRGPVLFFKTRVKVGEVLKLIEEISPETTSPGATV